MNKVAIKHFLLASLAAVSGAAFAQGPTPAATDPNAGSPQSPAIPVPSSISNTEVMNLPWTQEISGHRVPLDYEHIREADVFWSRTIWRSIDCREKMNLPFKWPDSPLIDVLLKAAESGEVSVYSGLDDEFKLPMDPKEIMQMAGATTDTVYVTDPVTGLVEPQVITKEINWENVNKFRIKEVWYFNKQTSTMMVRIMGISPILESYDEWGNYRGDLPMFWAYFPDLRKTLVKTPAYNPFPYGSMLSWDDLFSLRLFSSYVIKEENVRDYRIQDYATGLDALYESERVKNKLFTFEHDLWSY
jgi:gliding motility associated protien GldN